MSTTATTKNSGRKHRPKASTVFAAAFLAGAAAAVGVNRAFDVHLAQSVPQVESEPIFVAIRSLPKGSPVTIYDVALREWPKAMLPSTALRANTDFNNMVLRHPIQEGQPILSLQLAQVSPESTAQLAARAPTAVEPERVVQTAPLTPAPAFVPYEAATPIPAPVKIEQPQATVTPAAAADLAKIEPAAAEPVAKPAPQATPDPLSVAATETPIAETPIAETPAAETIAAGMTDDAPNETEASAPVPTTPEPTAVASADPTPETATTVASADAAVESSSDETTPAEEVAQPTAAPMAATVAAAEPTPAPEESTVEEPAVAPVANTARENAQPTEPTLADTNAPPAVVATVEPVDVTADVLAEAAARQAEAASAAETPAAMVESPAPETVVDSTITSSAQDQPAAAISPTPASQQVMRYLVVPERIALQVDHAFTRPQPTATVQPQPQQPKQSQGVRRLPETSTTAGRTRSNQSPATHRSSQDSSRQSPEPLQAAAGKVPQTPSQPKQPTSGIEQQAAADRDDADEPILKSLFPKLSAGLTTMGQEWREFRDGIRQPASSQQRATGPAKTSSPQRSAARPQQSR